VSIRDRRDGGAGRGVALVPRFEPVVELLVVLEGASFPEAQVTLDVGECLRPQPASSPTLYVGRHAVDAATEELADRQVFVLDGEAWEELEELLDRPPMRHPRLDALLFEPSVLEQPGSPQAPGAP
jgi:hypothetical protein